MNHFHDLDKQFPALSLQYITRHRWGHEATSFSFCIVDGRITRVIMGRTLDLKPKLTFIWCRDCGKPFRLANRSQHLKTKPEHKFTSEVLGYCLIDGARRWNASTDWYEQHKDCVVKMRDEKVNLQTSVEHKNKVFSLMASKCRVENSISSLSSDSDTSNDTDVQLPNVPTNSASTTPIHREPSKYIYQFNSLYFTFWI